MKAQLTRCLWRYSKVKQEQISQEAKNKLIDIPDELEKLNKEFLQTQDQTDIDKLEETKELYSSKYHGDFNKEAEKIIFFNERGQKWKNIEEHGQKYNNKEEL